jgi:hypothetical protein
VDGDEFDLIRPVPDANFPQGPLLQRASTTELAPLQDSTASLQVSLFPEIPRDAFGVWATSKQMGLTLRANPPFNDTVPNGLGTSSNYIQIWGGNPDFDIRLSKAYSFVKFPNNTFRGCSGTCEATISAPALAPTICTTKTLPLSLDELPNINTSANWQRFAAPLEQEHFMIALGLSVDKEKESVFLVTGYAEGGYSDAGTCTGSFVYTSCTLESAIGQYNVTISDGEVHFQNLAEPRILAIANNSMVNRELDASLAGQPSTLGWVAGHAWSEWSDSVVAYSTKGLVSTIEWGTKAIEFQKSGTTSNCPTFMNPQSRVMESMNMLMILGGAIAADQNATERARLANLLDPGLAIEATVPATRRGLQAVFDTNYWYFFAAALVEVVCVVFIAPTFYGWWRLGRSVSFSPIEIAKSFESPLLEACNSNSSGRDLAKKEGKVWIRYGEKQSQYGRHAKLGFGVADTINEPGKNTCYGV